MPSGPKRRYVKPVITRIQLDHTQAVLTACRVGGTFLNLAKNFCYFNGGTLYTCRVTPRGAGKFSNATSRELGSGAT